MVGEFPSVVEMNFPLYVLADEESGELLVSAEDVEGFFADPDDESPEVVFVRVQDFGMTGRRAEDAVLKIMNRRREKIGEYYIGRVVLGGDRTESPSGEMRAVRYRFFGNRGEYPAAAGIWRRWASGTALQKGEWLQWPVGAHGAWLDVVQNSWFASDRRAARYGMDDIVYVDGAHTSTKAGFFCALGEAVNGPGGYFGSNLDALASCLSSDFGEGPPVEVVWLHLKATEERLGHAFVDSVVEVMREFQVNVSTS